MDTEKDPSLLKWFEKIAPDKRLKNVQQLRGYLEKRYQFPIANQIATILAPRFQGFATSVSPQEYFKALETFVNQEKEENLRFVFKLFDVFNEDKITEAGLFKFMEDASMRKTD